MAMPVLEMPESWHFESMPLACMKTGMDNPIMRYTKSVTPISTEAILLREIPLTLRMALTVSRDSLLLRWRDDSPRARTILVIDPWAASSRIKLRTSRGS